VFAREDAWLATGDLMRRDADGDIWLVDHVATLVHTPAGVVPGRPIRDALEDLPAVDLAVTYGIARGNGSDIATAAVTLRAGAKLEAADITAALAPLPRDERPGLVRVVDEIPVTTWYRPSTGKLRTQGVPDARPLTPAWYHDARKDTYRKLTEAARKRLLA
jgi:putative long chain acyl-CoA synthase